MRFIPYALPQFAIAFVTLALINFTPSFYATEVGLDLGLLSLLILATRFSDVLTDPLIGWLSDRSAAPWGRRKGFMVAGVPVLVAGAWFLFHPPGGAGAVYFLVWYAVVFFGLTLIQLPFNAWGAEMSSDYDTRTRIASVREAVGATGSIAAIGILIVLAMRGDTALGSALHVAAIVLCVAVPLTVLVSLRAPATLDAVRPALTQVTTKARSVLRNRPFLLLLAGVFFIYMGITPGGAMAFFVYDTLMGRPDLFGINLLVQFVAAAVGIGFWSRLAQRIPKGRAVAAVLLWFGGLTAFMPILAELFGAWGVVGTAAVRSLALGAILALPYSIFADAVDIDTLRSGRERTGAHVGVAGVVIKLALTVGIALSFAVPDLFGFDPNSATNTDAALFSVAAVWSFLPGLLWLPAIAIFWNFPITREDAARTRAAIEAQAYANT